MNQVTCWVISGSAYASPLWVSHTALLLLKYYLPWHICHWQHRILNRSLFCTPCY